MNNAARSTTAAKLSLILSMAIISLFAGTETSAQTNTFGYKALIKESRKTDRNEALREEIVELNQLIKREPQNVTAYKIRAAHYFELKRCAEAVADYSQLIRLEPTVLEHRLERASCYEQMELDDQALADLDAVLKRAPRSTDLTGYEAYSALYSRYLIYLKLEANEKAIAALTEITKFRPNDESVYQSRSELYKQTKQYIKAIADYTQLIQINPRSTWGYLGRAEVFKILGESQKAEADAKAADEIIKKRGF